MNYRHDVDVLILMIIIHDQHQQCISSEVVGPVASDEKFGMLSIKEFI